MALKEPRTIASCIESAFIYLQFKGTTSFMVPMSEIKKHTSQLAGTKLKATVTVKDWYEIEVQPGKGTTHIIEDTFRIRFLGGKVRTFKPGTAFNVYVSVSKRCGYVLLCW